MTRFTSRHDSIFAGLDHSNSCLSWQLKGMWSGPVLFILAVLAAIGHITADRASHLSYDPKTGRGRSLAPSTWPLDHGDSSRTKFTIGAGLPKGELNPEDLKIVEQNGLVGPQWIYTYGENSEYIFVMGGTVLNTYVAKLDSVTLEILQKVNMKPAMYIGGMLMHANGHVYCIQGNRLSVYWNGNLDNSTILDLPTKLNSNAVQTNGMVVSSDGYLVIKQWSFILEDAALYLYAVPAIVKGIAALMLVCVALVLYLSPVPYKRKTVYTLSLGICAGSGIGLGVAVTFFILLQWRLFGFYDPIAFVTTNLWFNNSGGGGELKLIDPLTLEVVADLPLVERASFGRMALSALDNEEQEDAIILVGDEFIRQYRWNPVQKRLYEVESWAERYRSRNSGSFPGTGPAIYDNTVYFTDNTYPVMLWKHSYNLYSKRLVPATLSATAVGATAVARTAEEVVEPMKRLEINRPGMAGFMYWSVVISPVEGDIIVWDSAAQVVQVRKAGDLSMRYELALRQSDCISVAADKGHIYMTHYSGGPTDYSGHLGAIGPYSKVYYPDVDKYFIAVDAATGRTLLNVTIMSGEGLRPALIVPGAHNDVLVAKPNGLNRMYFEV